MLLRILVIIITVIFFSSDAVAVWPVFHGNNQHNGSVDESGPSKPEVKWRFKGKGIFILHSPVVAKDGTIYVLNGYASDYRAADTIYALTKDGLVKWNYTRPELRFTPPVVYGDTVLAVATSKIGKSGGYLISLDSKEGKLKWEMRLSEYSTEGWVSHIVGDSRGRIYVRIGDVLGAFTLAGEKIWVYRTVMADRASQTRGPTLSPDEKTLYFHIPDERGLMAFDVETGRIIWKDATAYYNEWSSPVVGLDGTVHIMDTNTNSLYAIKSDGKQKWKVEFKEVEYTGNGMIAVSADGKTIYITTESRDDIANLGIHGIIYALDRDNGKIKWKYVFKESGELASPITVDKNGRLYIGNGNGYVYCFDPEGGFLWKILAGYEVREDRKGKSGDDMRQIFMSGPVLSNDSIYIIAGNMSSFAELVAIGSK